MKKYYTEYLCQPCCNKISRIDGYDTIQVFKIVLNIDDISMNGLFEFLGTQTRGISTKLKRTIALKTFRIYAFYLMISSILEQFCMADNTSAIESIN